RGLQQHGIEQEPGNGETVRSRRITAPTGRVGAAEWRQIVGKNLEAPKAAMRDSPYGCQGSQPGEQRRGLRTERLAAGFGPGQVPLFQQGHRETLAAKQDGRRRPSGATTYHDHIRAAPRHRIPPTLSISLTEYPASRVSAAMPPSAMHAPP